MRSSRSLRSLAATAGAVWLVRRGSYRHQFIPICSALSMEQTSRRIWIVNNSTLARLILMSPAITRPLSRTRSRISTRPVLRDGETSSGNWQPHRRRPSGPRSICKSSSERRKTRLSSLILSFNVARASPKRSTSSSVSRPPSIRRTA